MHRLLGLQDEQREVRFLVLPPEQFAAGPAIEPAAVEAWYAANPEIRPSARLAPDRASRR